MEVHWGHLPILVIVRRSMMFEVCPGMVQDSGWLLTTFMYVFVLIPFQLGRNINVVVAV